MKKPAGLGKQAAGTNHSTTAPIVAHERGERDDEMRRLPRSAMDEVNGRLRASITWKQCEPHSGVREAKPVVTAVKDVLTNILRAIEDHHGAHEAMTDPRVVGALTQLGVAAYACVKHEHHEMLAAMAEEDLLEHKRELAEIVNGPVRGRAQEVAA